MRRTSLAFFLLAMAGLLPGGTEKPAQWILKGRVVDQRTEKGIALARVHVLPLHGDHADPEKKKGAGAPPGEKDAVVYTGPGGRWRVEIPLVSGVRIKVSANGYGPGRRIVSSTPGAEIEKDITIALSKGLSEIAWGSLEHLQLYVTPSLQESLEKWVREGDLASVTEYLERKVESDLQKYAWAFAGQLFFDRGGFAASQTCFEKAESRLWFNRMGHRLLGARQIRESLNHTLQGVTTRQRAADLHTLGEKLTAMGDPDAAARAFRIALADYRALSTSFRYRWDSEYIQMANACREKLARLSPETEGDAVTREELRSILRKAGEYCKRLEDAAIYYYCHEIKRDHVILLRNLAKAVDDPAAFFLDFEPVPLRGPKIVDYYKYDLQFIKEKGQGISEERKLLIENLDDSNPGIPVRSYSIRKALHGPHTLIGFGWQAMFDYRMAGRETLFGEQTVVLQADPRQEGILNRMSGKIWVVPDNGSVLKIEWGNRRALDQERIRTTGLILDREPHSRFVSEFGLQRNGLWFPTRCSITESYTREGEKPFIRLHIDIEYTNYNFFMVGSAVEYEE